MQVIETTGKITKNGQLKLDKPIQFKADNKVKVIVFFEEEEITEKEWLKTLEKNDAFDFLKDDSEDIYSMKDGKEFGS